MINIMKIVKSLEVFGLSKKSGAKTIKKKSSKTKKLIYWYVICTLSASLLSNLLTGKGMGRGVICAAK